MASFYTLTEFSELGDVVKIVDGWGNRVYGEIIGINRAARSVVSFSVRTDAGEIVYKTISKV